MLIPALITVGILGALYATRETESPEPPPAQLDAEMARYGQLILSGRGAEIDPGQLDSLSAHLRKANRMAEASTVDTWAEFVRAVKRGNQSVPLPPGLPSVPQLPPAQSSEPAAAPLPPALQARISLLTQQGEAASPFALEQLAGEIDRVSPGNYAVDSLRALARANRELMGVLRQAPIGPVSPVQGVPGTHDALMDAFGHSVRMNAQNAALRSVQSANFGVPFAASPFVVPRAAAFNLGSVRAPFSNQGLPIVPRSGLETPIARSGPARCTVQEGCALMKTPGSLYPTGVTVPFLTAVNVQQEQGDWLFVLYGTERGWVPKTDFLPEPGVLPEPDLHSTSPAGQPFVIPPENVAR